MPTISHLSVRKISYKAIGTWYSSLVKPKPKKPPYKHIVQIGDPCLRTPAEKLSNDLFGTPELHNFLKLMKHMLKMHNCVGISAPQVGLPIQVFIMEFNEKQAKCFTDMEFKNRDMSLLPQTVVINPTMKIVDYTKLIYPESCGSVKGMWADVPRFKAVELEGYNENGKSFKLVKGGWIARIIQHEMDHLQGILYTDIMNRKTLTCSCWNVINDYGGKVELPYGSS